MFIFNLTNILTLILTFAATILLIFLSQEIKNAKVALIPLIAFIVDLVIHTIQVLTVPAGEAELYSLLCKNMAIDFVFVLLTFLSYLWADETEAKANNKESIDHSLDWLFKKV